MLVEDNVVCVNDMVLADDIDVVHGCGVVHHAHEVYGNGLLRHLVLLMWLQVHSARCTKHMKMVGGWRNSMPL